MHLANPLNTSLEVPLTFFAGTFLIRQRCLHGHWLSCLCACRCTCVGVCPQALGGTSHRSAALDPSDLALNVAFLPRFQCARPSLPRRGSTTVSCLGVEISGPVTLVWSYHRHGEGTTRTVGGRATSRVIERAPTMTAAAHQVLRCCENREVPPVPGPVKATTALTVGCVAGLVSHSPVRDDWSYCGGDGSGAGGRASRGGGRGSKRAGLPHAGGGLLNPTERHDASGAPRASAASDEARARRGVGK